MFGALFKWLFGKRASKKTPTERLDDMLYQGRVDLEKKLKAKLRQGHGENAARIAELICNYIFDFGEFGYDFATGKNFRNIIEKELADLCNHQFINPKMLCQIMVHRAVQIKEYNKFDRHMRDLWILCLLPVGPFTPTDQFFPTQAHRNLAARLRTIEVTDRQITNCEKVWKNEEFLTAAKTAKRKP